MLVIVDVHDLGMAHLASENLSMVTTMFGMDAKLTVRTSVESFQARIADNIKSISERQKIATELINDSFLEASTDARFLLRISAIEALCPRGLRNGPVIKILEILKQKEKIKKMSEQEYTDLGQIMDHKKWVL